MSLITKGWYEGKNKLVTRIGAKLFFSLSAFFEERIESFVLLVYALIKYMAL